MLGRDKTEASCPGCAALRWRWRCWPRRRPALAQAAGPAASPPGTIRVVGEATVTAKPDMAELDLGVVSEATTAEAAARTTPRRWKVLAALKKEVGAGGEVKTVGYMVTQRLRRAQAQARARAGHRVRGDQHRARADPRREGRRPHRGPGAQEGGQRGAAPDLHPQEPRPGAGRGPQGRRRQGPDPRHRAGRGPGPAPGQRGLGQRRRLPAAPLYAESSCMRFKTADMADTPIEAGNLEVSATVTVFFATSR